MGSFGWGKPSSINVGPRWGRTLEGSNVYRIVDPPRQSTPAGSNIARCSFEFRATGNHPDKHFSFSIG